MITSNTMHGATLLSSGVRCVAPQAQGMGAESAFFPIGNPIPGTDVAVARVRDAKQAAPPRGELC